MKPIKLSLFLGILGVIAPSTVQAAPSPNVRLLPFNTKERLSPTKAQFSRDGRLFAALSYPFSNTGGVTFQAWSTQTGKAVASWRLQTLDKFALAPQGRTTAIISRRQIPDERLWHGYYEVCAVQIRDLYTGKLKKTILREGAINANVHALAWSNDGQFLATGSGDGLARVWEVSSGRRVASLRAQGYVGAVQFSPDGKRLATVGDTNGLGARVRLWNWKQKKLLNARSFPTTSLFATLTFSSDGKYLAIGDSSNGRTALVDVPRLQLQQTLPAPTDAGISSNYPTPEVAFSQKTNLSAFACGNDVIARSLTSAPPVMRFVLKKPSTDPFPLATHNPYVLGLRFLPDNQLCWVTVDDHFEYEVSTWGLTLPKLYTTVSPHNSTKHLHNVGF